MCAYLLLFQVGFVEFEIVDLDGKRARIGERDLLLVAEAVGQYGSELHGVLGELHLRLESLAATQEHETLAALRHAYGHALLVHLLFGGHELELNVDTLAGHERAGRRHNLERLRLRRSMPPAIPPTPGPPPSKASAAKAAAFFLARRKCKGVKRSSRLLIDMYDENHSQLTSL